MDRRPLTHSLLGAFLVFGTLASGCGSSAADDELGERCEAEVEKSLDGLPDSLTCTGLYRDFGKKKLARQMREFAPAFPLWSDGAEKRRWIG